MSLYYEKQWQNFNKNFTDDIADAVVPQSEPEPVEEDNMYTRRRRRALYHTMYTHYDRCQAAVTIQKYARRMIIQMVLNFH